jgi:hypothetical protein
MYDLLELSWGAQLTVVRLILLSQFALVLISAVRFVKSARRLYRYSGESILTEDIIKGDADPDQLAASALGSRLPCKAILEYRASSKIYRERTSAEKVPQVLRVAKSRFQYLWERCYADVESGMRASLLSFLLSLVMIAYAAIPTFNRYIYNRGAYPFRAVAHLLVLLTLGWSCCTVLYFASSLFKRKLAERKTDWRYFCSILDNELSR